LNREAATQRAGPPHWQSERAAGVYDEFLPLHPVAVCFKVDLRLLDVNSARSGLSDSVYERNPMHGRIAVRMKDESASDVTFTRVHTRRDDSGGIRRRSIGIRDVINASQNNQDRKTGKERPWFMHEVVRLAVCNAR